MKIHKNLGFLGIVENQKIFWFFQKTFFPNSFAILEFGKTRGFAEF